MDQFDTFEAIEKRSRELEQQQKARETAQAQYAQGAAVHMRVLKGSQEWAVWEEHLIAIMNATQARKERATERLAGQKYLSEEEQRTLRHEVVVASASLEGLTMARKLADDVINQAQA